MFLRGKQCFTEWHALAHFTNWGGALNTYARLIFVITSLMWLAASVFSRVLQRLWPWPGRILYQKCRRKANRDASFDAKRSMFSLQWGTLSLLTAACVQRQMSSPWKSHFPLAFWLCWISKVCGVFFQAVPFNGKCLIYSFLRPSINLSFISSETAGVLRSVPLMITNLPFV